MIVPVLGIMVPIVSVIGAFIMVVYLRKYENAERMAMIERGVDPTLFTQKKQGVSPGTLRAALLFIGAGIGLLIAYFLDRQYDMAEVGYFSMIFIFGGLGLGAAYLVEDRKFRAQHNNNQ
ncbi:MAG: hypothetical protein MUE95_04700 [Cyclobacteriaceae bacterium]|jgi:hypothetical protein|nr:hypothetical protein [Cyclobacteriaceae bacterium]